jgi:hypothetical protein
VDQVSEAWEVLVSAAWVGWVVDQVSVDQDQDQV